MLRESSARHISQIPLSYMNSNRSGELLSKMSTDADSVQSFMEGDFIQLIQLPFTIVFYAIYLIWLNPILFLACFCNSSDLDSTWSQFLLYRLELVQKKIHEVFG